MTSPRPAAALHVLSVDLPPEDAARMPEDQTALDAAMGGIEVDRTRVELIDPAHLEGVGLSGYLTDGQGADADAVLPDEPRLDAIRDPVLLLLPGAVKPDVKSLYPKAPLTLVGSYPLEAAKPAEGTLRSPSAEGLVTGAPPQAAPENNRRASGYVAIVALVFALLVAFIVWLVAA